MATKPIPHGTRFSRLVVIGVGEPDITPSGWKASTSICKCDCGNVVTTRNAGLRNGNAKSCGCLRSDKARARALKHGHSTRSNGATGAYRTWQAMHRRCKANEDYTSRGIVVCERWSSFEFFLEDMGERPADANTIERIDNNAGYFPGNCRWATRKEQNRNKRNTRYVTVGGASRCLAEVCEEFHVDYFRVHKALKTGRTIDEALIEAASC